MRSAYRLSSEPPVFAMFTACLFRRQGGNDALLVGSFFGYRNVVQSLVTAAVSSSSCEASFEVAMGFVAWLRENHVKDADYVTRQWLAKVIAKAKAGEAASPTETSPKERATGPPRVPLAPHGQIGEAFSHMRQVTRSASRDEQRPGAGSGTPTRRERSERTGLNGEAVAELEQRERKLKARAAKAASTYNEVKRRSPTALASRDPSTLFFRLWRNLREPCEPPGQCLPCARNLVRAGSSVV